MVVDRSDRIVYFSGNTTPYVSQPSGEPTRDVFELLKPSLRAAARAVLRKAAANGAAVTIFTEVGEDGQLRYIHMTAAPLPTTKVPEYFRLSFESTLKPIGEVNETRDRMPQETIASALPFDPQQSGLEQELHTMRRELQSTVEAFEASNEELKASNEEVVSINEELQSANEELETGKEELQSLNEELITVNAQLQAKITELEASTNDLSNLLSSTSIAVVFLDTQFRVRRFTPAVYDLLELIPGDIGRPIANLAQKFVGGGLLEEDARTVLARLIPQETEVLSDSGSWYLRRTLPYRTADNHIDGVVVTFVDITARRRAEEALKSSQARLQAVVEQLPVAMLMVDAEHKTLLHANEPAAKLLGLPYPVPLVGSEWQLAVSSFAGQHHDGRPFKPDEWPLARSLTDSRAIEEEEIEFRQADGSQRVLAMSSTPVKDADGRVVVVAATFFDITERRLASMQLRESEQRLHLLIDSALDYAIFTVDLQGRILSWNRGAERLLGWTDQEAIGRPGAMIFTPEDRGAGIPERELETARRDRRAVDERIHQRKSGERFWASGMMMAVYDDNGTPCRFAKIIRDETERKEAEEELQRALREAERVRATAESANRAKDEFISTISHELRTPLNTIRLWARMLGFGSAAGTGSHRRRAHDRSLRRGAAAPHRRPARRIAHVFGPVSLEPAADASERRGARRNRSSTAVRRRSQSTDHLQAERGRRHRARQSRTHPAGHLESDLQCSEVHSGRRRHRSRDDAPRRRSADRRPGFGHRHSPGIPAARVRTVPAGRSDYDTAARRPGPRPRDREATGRAARRHDHRAQRRRGSRCALYRTSTAASRQRRRTGAALSAKRRDARLE